MRCISQANNVKALHFFMVTGKNWKKVLVHFQNCSEGSAWTNFPFVICLYFLSLVLSLRKDVCLVERM
jgi:hypothetical protein